MSTNRIEDRPAPYGAGNDEDAGRGEVLEAVGARGDENRERLRSFLRETGQSDDDLLPRKVVREEDECDRSWRRGLQAFADVSNAARSDAGITQISLQSLERLGSIGDNDDIVDASGLILRGHEKVRPGNASATLDLQARRRNTKTGGRGGRLYMDKLAWLEVASE